MIPFSRAPRILIAPTVLLFLLMNAGCLRIKQESIVARFSPDNKRMELLLVYEGLYVGRMINVRDDGRVALSTKPESPNVKDEDRRRSLELAKEQLADFVDSEQQFSLSTSPIFGQVDLRPKPDDPERQAKAKRMLLKSLRIRNVAFFLNDRDELSGYQVISFDIKEFEDTINSLASEAIAQMVTIELSKLRNVEEGFELSAESLWLLEKAANEGHRWITIAPGKITLDFPLSVGDAKHLLAEAKADEYREASQEIKSVFGAVRIVETDDGLRVVLGDGSRRSFLYQTKRSNPKGLFEDELLAYARTLKIPFDCAKDAKSLIAEYLGEPAE